MTSVKIDEFSTGIRYQLNSNGSWVSLGFTGQYMNVTRESIPPCVKRSIANKEFAVSEGASSEKPAIIGRVVLGDNEGDWSVVALVSKGWDEKGRSASFYRYFLSQGKDKLPTILAWIEDYQENHKNRPISIPVFNPSERKAVGDYHQFPFQASAQNTQSLPPIILESSQTNIQSLPIILEPSQKHTPEEIHALADEKANGQPISWAFNVEALEQPWRFVVIKAGSDRAYQLLQKAIANPPKLRTPVLFDEQALTSAIKSLMGNSTVKPESLNIFVEALANKDIKEDYCSELFNSQGAMNALRQNIYGSQMVRLLTLRTLAIPKTLKEYLEWLKFDENLNKKKLNQPIITSLQFQSQLLPLLSKLPQSYPNLTKLLQELGKLRQDFKDYSLLANLFEKIGDYVQEKLSDNHLAILYYKLSAYLGNENGRISNKLFDKAFPNQHSPQKFGSIRIYTIRQEKKIVPIQFVILLVSLIGIGTFAGGYYLGKSHSSPSDSNTIENIDKPPANSNKRDNSNTAGNNTKTNNQPITQLNIPEDKQEKAIKNFETNSVTAIENIIRDIQTSFPTVAKEVIIMALKQKLGNEKLDYNALVDKNEANYPKYRNEWINAIYNYQETNGLGADGIISPQGQTIKSLKEKLTENFNSTSNPSPTPDQIPVSGE